MKSFKEYLAESEAQHNHKPKRFQFQNGPDPKEYGEPENVWNPPGTQPALSQQYMDWRSSEQGKAHAAASSEHFKKQSAEYAKHKERHGRFDTTLEEIPNPYYDPNGTDDEEDPNYQPELIDVGVDYDYHEDPYIPARIRYDDYDHPEEGGDDEVYIRRVVDLDTGEDITKVVDTEEIERQIIAHHQEYRESVDPTDTLLESIKRLSGLK
jgi:hypothetical protein